MCFCARCHLIFITMEWGKNKNAHLIRDNLRVAVVRPDIHRYRLTKVIVLNQTQDCLMSEVLVLIYIYTCFPVLSQDHDLRIISTT